MSDTYSNESPRSVKRLRPSAREPFPRSNRSAMISDERSTGRSSRHQKLQALADILSHGLEGLRASAK